MKIHETPTFWGETLRISDLEKLHPGFCHLFEVVSDRDPLHPKGLWQVSAGHPRTTYAARESMDHVVYHQLWGFPVSIFSSNSLNESTLECWSRVISR